MSKTKVCRGCNQPFTARRGAKTCSARCRKRFQRAKAILMRDALSVEKGISDICNMQVPGQLYHPRLVADETKELAEPVLKEETHNNVFPTEQFITEQKQVESRGFMRWLILPFILLTFFALSGIGRALSISQGYTSNDANLKKGMVVSLSNNSTQNHPAVQSADVTNVDKVMGVVVGINDSIITVGSANSQVFVATAGQAEVYVGDLNGEVKRGDLLSLSPLKGILMKASETGAVGVIGTALEDFPAASAQAVVAKDNANKPVTVYAALVNADINIKPTTAGTAAQNWFQRLGKSITGHDVGQVRVISALAIFITLLVIEGTIIYSAISSSLISIGRNPLAKSQILRQLVRSTGVAVGVLLTGGAVIVIILWF